MLHYRITASRRFSDHLPQGGVGGGGLDNERTWKKCSCVKQVTSAVENDPPNQLRQINSDIIEVGVRNIK